jgi:hypothetical protein
MYEASQAAAGAQAAQPGAGPTTDGQPAGGDENVIDAEFEKKA